MNNGLIPQQPTIVPLYIVEGMFRRAVFIATTFLSLMIAAIACAVLIPKHYQAEMKLLVNNSRPQLVLSAGPNSDTPQEIVPVVEADVNTEMDLLDSADLLRKVVVDTGLDQSIRIGRSEQPSRRIDRAVERLRSDLQITNLHKSNVILIRYSAASPQLARQVLQELWNQYTVFVMDLSRSASAARFFREEAANHEIQLRNEQLELVKFHTEEGLSDINEQRSQAVRQIFDTQKTLQDTSANLYEVIRNADQLRKEINSRSETVRQTKIVPNQEAVQHLSTLAVELANQRSTLADKFKPGDRAIAEIDQQITATTKARDRAEKVTFAEDTITPNPVIQQLQTDLARANSERAALTGKRAALNNFLRTDRTRMRDYETALLTEARLQDAIKRDQSSYDLYSRKAEEARIASSLDQDRIVNVSVAESPVAGTAPVFPKKSVFIGLGLILATFCSFGGALFAEVRSGALYTAREIERRTGIPVLATIPSKAPGGGFAAWKAHLN